MVITVASGKGGTGKTTVSTCLALHLAQNNEIRFLDLDVEEPNADIFLKIPNRSDEPVTKFVPGIDYEKCTFCGMCADLCAFSALALVPDKEVIVFPELCHSCGMCMHICPEAAINSIPYEIGKISAGNANKLWFYEGLLNIGEVAAPEVIKQVKLNIKPDTINILDSPPGTSCSVVESVDGSDFCILVTEPSLFGLNDLKLMVELIRTKNIPFGIIINQWEEQLLLIDDYAREENIPVLARIPFDRDIAVAYSRGIPFINAIPQYENIFADIIPQVLELTGS